MNKLIALLAIIVLAVIGKAIAADVVAHFEQYKELILSAGIAIASIPFIERYCL